MNHRSRYLWSMLTQFGRRRQIWKMCKRASVTTTGTSMATQLSGKIGHVSLDLSACRNPNKRPGQILHGKSSNTKRINEKHTKQKMLHVREETGKTSISSNAEYHISLRHPVQRMRESTHAGNGWTFYTFEQQHDFLEAHGRKLLNSHQDHTAERGFSFDVSLRVGSYSDNNSKGDEFTSSEKLRYTGTSSRICLHGATRKFVPKQKSNVKLSEPRDISIFAC